MISISEEEFKRSPVNVMLVTNQLQPLPSGGRELLCNLNHEALKEIYGDSLVLIQLRPSRLRRLLPVINAFRGHIDGLDDALIAEVIQTILAKNVVKVFVDGSNLGGLVKSVKKELPRIESITFFHNVEARFFLGSFWQVKTMHALVVLMVNYLAERKSVLFSDKLICLSERDSTLLKRLYGRAATHVSTMAMLDKYPASSSLIHSAPREKFALFVGGAFYANKAGITWFVKNVVPRIQTKICIVGKGFEDMKDVLGLDGKVEVVGAVDSLAQWYQNAHFVIAPIFDGSGMKTKVAEALMFGKKIVGTPEAFSGYENVADRAGWVCKSVDEFVAAIWHVQDLNLKECDPELRALFEKTYSFGAARARLETIMNA